MAPAELVYGTHAVREALRGRREVLRVWCTARAGEASPWLPDSARVERAERLEQLAGSPDHQGVVAEVAPYPYADPDELLGRENALLVALDEVTDPHNLGAVARVAEGAGAHGLLTTRRRSAAVTAAVARASAGAIEHLPVAQVENLADTLIRAGGPGCGATGRPPTRTRPTTRLTIATARCSCWVRRAGGCGRACCGHAMRRSPSRWPGGSSR